MEVVKLNISGMHCSACSATITHSLERVSGIGAIKINSISGRAKISYDSTKLTPQEIMNLITSYGFPASLDNAKELEIAYIQGLKKRLFVAVPLFLSIFILHMGGFHGFLSGLVQLILASIVQFYCAYPFYVGAKSFFKTKSADMNVLIALGTSVAYLYSLYLMYLGDEGGYYFEGSSAVICFVLLGEFLKSRAKKQASDELELLAKILPQKARKIVEDKALWCEIKEIKKEDICLVVSGEKIPLDGIILKGEAEVSSAHINGEEMPKVLKTGDEVVGGSVLLNGELYIKATKDSSEFFVYEMLDLLELSQTQKPPIGALADKIASIFVPSVVLLSIISALIWLFLGYEISFVLSIVAAILVVSCPCALGLAVPLAIVCASMRAKKSEILIKNPDVYEKAKEIKFIALDKTGTLTKGEISLKNVEFFTSNTEEILSLAKAMQEHNPHPIAKAIINYTQDLQPLKLEEKEYLIAKGIRAKYKDEEYFLGALEWIEEILGKNLQVKRENLIALSNKKELLALFYLQDSIKEGAKEMIISLKALGITPVILSGDNTQSVEKIAKTLGIEEFYAQINPTQKADKIAKLNQKGKVCFVGDGINDALALKEASFGISFVNATELAKEVGDVLLLKDDLKGIVEVFKLSFATLKNIKQNLFFAYVYNLVLIPIAAGILYPFFGIVLQPAFAGAAMAFSSVSVVLNALRISKINLDK
ncbi:heavy metal translocating P-type ATPase [Helicobacter burdigaliensis]|uniref:heavy metal translocating P-type ATPase n=1 Tax=Helicobacter burdigaliensis TaxID=2315334 RepID=UPI000EF6832E|nr:cation-translocating P-type ATPase [Helicobacter burdigaliensis]